MNILIVKLSAIGDVVQTLPALEAIKIIYPSSRITWIVEEAAAGILEGHQSIDTILISRRKTWLRMLKNPFTFSQGIAHITRFFRILRSTRYDIAIDFQGLFKSGILIGFARAERKIGFNGTREGSALFLNERLPAYDIEKHALQRYLDIARYLGSPKPSFLCTLPIQREQAVIRRRIATINPDNRPLVILNPMARWKTKLWPAEHFAQLADRLVLEKRALVIFTGSNEDKQEINHIRSLMTQDSHDWAGETTLKELAALASCSDLFITTDTGPMHLAAAAGATVVALFGPTAPWRTGPYGERHIVIRMGIKCSPCFQRSCDAMQCMKAITPEEVMKRIPLP
ncbi:MAG: lipopolysaccharide heptosyltransferase II [Nitrospirota bacterium]